MVPANPLARLLPVAVIVATVGMMTLYFTSGAAGRNPMFMFFPVMMLASIVGCLIGAFVNYGLALAVGRPFLERYGRYFFIAPHVLHKTDDFFERHGAISTFTGRLIPGIRQLISIPAGLARMRIATFAFYTAFGAGLWSLVLIALGYFIGGNEALIRENLPLVTVAALVFVALTLLGYVLWNRRRQPAQAD